jgi:hypothetical protein
MGIVNPENSLVQPQIAQGWVNVAIIPNEDSSHLTMKLPFVEKSQSEFKARGYKSKRKRHTLPITSSLGAMRSANLWLNLFISKY